MSSKPRFLDALAARAVRGRLARIRRGLIHIAEAGVQECFGVADGGGSPEATVRVHDARFWSELASGGSIGAGEAYMAGYWDADDLTAVLRILLRNIEVMDGMEGGVARLAGLSQKLWHALNRNTRAGARRNIAAHYDLGNEFFGLFLDPTLMYSCAIFERPDTTLEEAQVARLQRICRKLELKPRDHLLEIGAGWGSLAIHAAQRFGCRVTTTTISREQHALATERVAAAGLDDRVTVLLEDYRDLRGRYDKLVSIEMIEAVGHQFYDAYFSRCARLLRNDGLMLLQAITIDDRRYEAARDSVDFIKRYIFPGCCIPSLRVLVNSISRATDMQVIHLEDIGLHYATTLERWRENLLANIDRVRALGYPDAFVRMWVYYFCYCEAGFSERATGDVQLLLAKPASGITSRAARP